VEEGMVFDVIDAIDTKSLVRACTKLQDEVFCFGREFCLSGNV
jgi:hypothetical protein